VSAGREVLEQLKRSAAARAAGEPAPSWEEPVLEEEAAAPAPLEIPTTCRCGHERGEHVTAGALERQGCAAPECTCVVFTAAGSSWTGGVHR